MLLRAGAALPFGAVVASPASCAALARASAREVSSLCSTRCDLWRDRPDVLTAGALDEPAEGAGEGSDMLTSSQMLVHWLACGADLLTSWRKGVRDLGVSGTKQVASEGHKYASVAI